MELDFSGLLACYSNKGRTGFNPIMLYAVVTYANMRGVRVVDRIVDLCQRDLAFIWLTKGQKPQRDVFYDFKGKKLTGEVLDELNYQFMCRLEKEGFLTLKELYIDGTKLEANANRYTFVWRGSLNYHLAGLLDTIDALYTKYNAFLLDNGYGPKYGLGDAHMFVIEEMDKVREIIKKNRERKLTKHKKIPNNTIIEIDHCSPLEIRKLQKNLMRIAEGEGIEFVFGKGMRKPEIQKLYEELKKCGKRLMEYKECFKIMGKDRNSYSKTDLEATFMRMKEDHMLNGQLKPAYNVQIAVENYFIVHGYISNDRTDYNTLIPVLKKHRKAFGDKLEAVTADSGYCSECEYKSKCLYKYNPEKNPNQNKVMKINERWEELREESNTNIPSEEGILKRQKRSRKRLSQRSALKNPAKGLLRPKIVFAKRRRQSPIELRLKKSVFCGIVSVLFVRNQKSVLTDSHFFYKKYIIVHADNRDAGAGKVPGG